MAGCPRTHHSPRHIALIVCRPDQNKEADQWGSPGSGARMTSPPVALDFRVCCEQIKDITTTTRSQFSPWAAPLTQFLLGPRYFKVTVKQNLTLFSVVLTQIQLCATETLDYKLFKFQVEKIGPSVFEAWSNKPKSVFLLWFRPFFMIFHPQTFDGLTLNRWMKPFDPVLISSLSRIKLFKDLCSPLDILQTCQSPDLNNNQGLMHVSA